MSEETRYLLVVSGGVEPETFGPYDLEETRDKVAREIHANLSEEDGLFGLDVKDGVPHVWSYIAGFFEEGGEAHA